MNKFLLLFSIAGMITCTACSDDNTAVAAETTDTTEGTQTTVTIETTTDLTFAIVDTNQSQCYDDQDAISSPAAGQAFYGQDAQYDGHQPQYVDNGDGTITDQVTGLMWQQTSDTNQDGVIDASDKMSYEDALAMAEDCTYAGYSDWRVPTIKELYSLILFSGVDPSGYEEEDTSGLIPFIDTNYFEFAYGDTSANERIIDSQYVTTTLYNSTTMLGDETLFGVNFADGRIKGYGLELFGRDKTFCVLLVRGNEDYGINNYVDNNDGTISDLATGLMWMQDDNGEGLNWEEALAYAESAEVAGYSDWRLPNAKELQSILDYSRSPDITDSAAIDALFNCSEITNEAGAKDYPLYWSSTTHSNWSDVGGAYGCYVAFGRAMGYMEGQWLDVHGAGAQRSDPKSGDATDYPEGSGPQGDCIRIYNHVRLVRNID